jgi:hypothetical protein
LVEPQTPTVPPPFPRSVIDMGSGADLWSRYIGDRRNVHRGRICKSLVAQGYGNVQLQRTCIFAHLVLEGAGRSTLKISSSH